MRSSFVEEMFTRSPSEEKYIYNKLAVRVNEIHYKQTSSNYKKIITS